MDSSSQPDTDPANSPLLEAVPVAETPETEGKILEACPACGGMMDVTEQVPFADVRCPSCDQPLRVRKIFRNFIILDQIGEGGMGWVFRAVDSTLNRVVALKVLKRELSADAEGRAKLEMEARMTASINHPHVVKVFSFGEDHGEFFLAMEYVEKGTLDELMGLQGNVAESQMLDVGIQIAQGLQAALEKGLIHRDLKPGNILFADAKTAKLVDFGLAIVMDEAAQARGEIWGTPYYIAPEKLDNQPEDFRSDMYSLGGTLFHAMAGRPPYEAASASMVALKQLKSQPVSLEAFAPDISSETAYVINRMLAKNPNDRYQSYEELIQHLTYARQKLRDRAGRAVPEKPRVVIESSGGRLFSAIITIGLLLAVLIGGGIFLYATFFTGGPAKDSAIVENSALSQTEIKTKFDQAVKLIGSREFAKAEQEFRGLIALPHLEEPMKSWVVLNQAATASLAGDLEEAAAIYENVRNAGPYTTESPNNKIASFFVECSKLLSKSDEAVPASVRRIYSSTNYEAFGIFSFAVRDWMLGKLSEAQTLFETFEGANIQGDLIWMKSLQPFAADCSADCKIVMEVEGLLKSDPASAAARIPTARAALKVGGPAASRLDELEKQAVAAASGR